MRIHAMPQWQLGAIRANNGKPPKRRRGRPGRCRVNAKLSEEQVKNTLRLYERHGTPPTKIAGILNITLGQVHGVIYGGNGTRTVLIK